MKIKTNDIPLEMGGVKVEGEFRIRNSAKAFNILSSGLYSNKIEAILRELGCNAYDSHVEAGKADVPFTVHLPTSINPQFYVRDYGIGLDHDGVTKLYTTYFESTKQDSNDFVGCLGLGSKSPFSYTRNFTVTAIKDGVERIYNCFINESGIPSVALLNEQKTDACNGVEVRFAVNNRSDMSEFAQTARNVYRWFKVPPEVTGNNIDIPEVKFQERDIATGVHILEGRYGRHYHSRESFAMMGNVVYPIKLPEQDSVPKLIRNLVSAGNYLFEFNIGELDVAASREELSYDDATVKAIVAKAQTLIDSATAFLAKQVDAEKTCWKKAQKLLEVVSKDTTLFRPASEQYLKTAPPVLKAMFSNSGYGLRIGLSIPSNMHDETVALTYVRAEATSYNNDDIRLSRVKPYHDYLSNDQTHYIDHDDTVFIVQDDRGNLLGRIRKACTDQKNGLKKGSHIFIVRRCRRNGDTEALWKKVSKKLGDPPVIYASALPKLDKAVKTKHGEVKAYSFEQCNGPSRWSADVFRFRPGPKKLANFKRVDGKIVYLPLKGKQAMWDGSITSASDLLKRMMLDGGDDGFACLLNEGQTDKISATSIYAVNGESLKTAKKSADWISLSDFINERLNKLDWAALENEVEMAAKASVLKDLQIGVDVNMSASRPMMSYDHPTSPYGELVRTVSSLKGSKKALSQLYRLQQASRFLPNRKGKVEEIDKRRETAVLEMTNLIEKVQNQYPLIRYISMRGSDTIKMEQALREYVEAIDKQTN